MLEAAETQGPVRQLTFTDGPPAVACRGFQLCTGLRAGRDKAFFFFFASTNWDVTIVQKTCHLKDYSLKMLQSGKLHEI